MGKINYYDVEHSCDDLCERHALERMAEGATLNIERVSDDYSVACYLCEEDRLTNPSVQELVELVAEKEQELKEIKERCYNLEHQVKELSGKLNYVENESIKTFRARNIKIFPNKIIVRHKGRFYPLIKLNLLEEKVYVTAISRMGNRDLALKLNECEIIYSNYCPKSEDNDYDPFIVNLAHSFNVLANEVSMREHNLEMQKEDDSYKKFTKNKKKRVIDID